MTAQVSDVKLSPGPSQPYDFSCIRSHFVPHNASSHHSRVFQTPQANPSSHQLQPLRDKKERTNKEDQTKNANSAGSTDLPDRDLEVEEEGQAIGGDGGGTNSHEDDRESPEDFDTAAAAMKEEEEDIDDNHENHLTGNEDPLSLGDVIIFII